MARKLLIITPRIPDTSTARNARSFSRIARLARRFETHLVYIQSMFVKEEAVAEMAKTGVNVIPFSSLKQGKETTLEARVSAATGAAGFDALLFNTHFSAKYYLPYLEGFAKTAVVAVDACNSPYVSESRLLRECGDFEDRVQLLKSIEINRMKEVGVYHNADVVLVDSEREAEDLRPDIPFVGVFAYPAHEADDGAALGGLFEGFRKKALPPLEKDAVTLMRVSCGPREIPGVRGFNEALRAMTGEFALIAPEPATVPERSLERLVLCLQSNPRYGIAVPSSTLEVENMPAAGEAGSEFLQKHYIANFGFWRETRRVNGSCLLVRKKLRDEIGLLDARFSTLHYALFDYFLKAMQAGYTAVLANESFVFYPGRPSPDDGAMEKDRALLYRKWCDAGTEYTENMAGSAS